VYIMKKLTPESFQKNLQNIIKENFIVIHGEERFFHDELVQQIDKTIFKNRAERDLNYHQFSGTEDALNEILKSCMSYPMLAERSLVIVREYNKLKFDDTESFGKYIINPQPTTLLVILAPKLPTNRVTEELVARALSVQCRKPGDEEVYKWVNRKLKLAGIESEAESIQFLIENIGNNLLHLNHEVEKIINFIGKGNKLTVAEVSELTGFNREVNIFNLQKSLGVKNLDKSLKIGLQLLEQKDSLTAILPNLFTFFRRIWIVKQLRAKNLNNRQILSEVKGNQFGYIDVFSSIENFSYKKIFSIIQTLEKTEVQLKTTQRSSESLFTILCYSICK